MTGGGRQDTRTRPGTSHGVLSPTALEGSRQLVVLEQPTPACRRVWFLTIARLALRLVPIRPCFMPVAPVGLCPSEPLSSRRSVPLSGSCTLVSVHSRSRCIPQWNPYHSGVCAVWAQAEVGGSPAPRLPFRLDVGGRDHGLRGATAPVLGHRAETRRGPRLTGNSPFGGSVSGMQQRGESRLQGVTPFGKLYLRVGDWPIRWPLLSWAFASSRVSVPVSWIRFRGSALHERCSACTRRWFAGPLLKGTRTPDLACLFWRLLPVLRSPTLSHR